MHLKYKREGGESVLSELIAAASAAHGADGGSNRSNGGGSVGLGGGDGAGSGSGGGANGPTAFPVAAARHPRSCRRRHPSPPPPAEIRAHLADKASAGPLSARAAAGRGGGVGKVQARTALASDPPPAAPSPSAHTITRIPTAGILTQLDLPPSSLRPARRRCRRSGGKDSGAGGRLGDGSGCLGGSGGPALAVAAAAAK